MKPPLQQYYIRSNLYYSNRGMDPPLQQHYIRSNLYYNNRGMEPVLQQHYIRSNNYYSNRGMEPPLQQHYLRPNRYYSNRDMESPLQQQSHGVSITATLDSSKIYITSKLHSSKLRFSFSLLSCYESTMKSSASNFVCTEEQSTAFWLKQTVPTLFATVPESPVSALYLLMMMKWAKKNIRIIF